MSAVERAVEVIEQQDRVFALDPDHGQPPTPKQMAYALLDAGLLVTDADRAVLDAAEVIKQAHDGAAGVPCSCSVCVAVRARREAQP